MFNFQRIMNDEQPVPCKCCGVVPALKAMSTSVIKIWCRNTNCRNDKAFEGVVERTKQQALQSWAELQIDIEREMVK